MPATLANVTDRSRHMRGCKSRRSTGSVWLLGSRQAVRREVSSATTSVLMEKDSAARSPSVLKAQELHLHRHDVGISRVALALRMLLGPHGVVVDGHRLVFWRSDDGVIAMDDVCVHRGMPLSSGHVSDPIEGCGRRLVCPYHHWSFDAQGRITDVPTEKEGRWPKRRMQRTYRIAYESGRVIVYDDS